MTPAAATLFDALEGESERILPARRGGLDGLASRLGDRLRAGHPAEVVVICTHNSRRSQIGQLWLQAAAARYGVPLRVFSGGTEATAFHPNAVAAMERAGWRFEAEGEGNPRYRPVAPGGLIDDEAVLFSKTFDDPSNPAEGFAAIMVCSEADEACPFVPGAAERLSLPFTDPKEADGTAREKEAYDEAVRSIGREMVYLLQRITGSAG